MMGDAGGKKKKKGEKVVGQSFQQHQLPAQLSSAPVLTCTGFGCVKLTCPVQDGWTWPLSCSVESRDPSELWLCPLTGSGGYLYLTLHLYFEHFLGQKDGKFLSSAGASGCFVTTFQT